MGVSWQMRLEDGRICEKVYDCEQLLKQIQKDRQAGKQIVSTSGCFDILHAGHVTYLKEARAKGDRLVVMLNSDVSVQHLKGKERPIVPQVERAVVLAGLESVDYLVLFDEDTPCSLIARLQPDVVVKGGDYEGVHIPEMDETAKYGGHVAYVSMVAGCSSTNIIEKIKSLVAMYP